MKSKKIKYIIGIDEVGRGALAGPVVVAALALKINFKINPLIIEKKSGKNFKLKLKDSKKLSLKQREKWLDFIKNQKIPYTICAESPKIIDKINISNAANLAASKALKKLIKNYRLKSKSYGIFLDGGLYIKNLKLKNLNTKTIIKGDEKIPAISLASIAAKVYRDRLMKKLQKKYPQYDFIHNVGYGTKTHIKAIKKRGFSKIHRRTFKI